MYISTSEIIAEVMNNFGVSGKNKLVKMILTLLGSDLCKSFESYVPTGERIQLINSTHQNVITQTEYIENYYFHLKVLYATHQHNVVDVNFIDVIKFDTLYRCVFDVVYTYAESQYKATGNLYTIFRNYITKKTEVDLTDICIWDNITHEQKINVLECLGQLYDRPSIITKRLL